jgi:hypothetical protein
MKVKGTRTFIEVRVGASQSAEVVLHVRQADIQWFNCDDHFAELLSLLQTSVLPRMFAEEIEKNDAAHRKQKLPPDLGPGGIPITVGEKNTAAIAASNNNKKPAKRKRGLSKKKQAELKRQEEQAERDRRKNERDVYYAVSDSLKIVYRLEGTSSGATLLFGNTKKGFRQLKRLSKRILLWCYPVDADDNLEEGFLRPEIIPIASIFRSSNVGKEVIAVDEE